MKLVACVRTFNFVVVAILMGFSAVAAAAHASTVHAPIVNVSTSSGPALSAAASSVSKAGHSSALNPLLQHDPKTEALAAKAPAAAAVSTATIAPASVRTLPTEPAEPSSEPSEPNHTDSNWAISPDYDYGMPI